MRSTGKTLLRRGTGSRRKSRRNGERKVVGVGKIRVYELAKELKLSNKDVIERLAKAGISVKSHNNPVEEEAARAALSKAEIPKGRVPERVKRGEPAAKADIAKRLKEGVEAKPAPEPEAAASPTPAPPDPAPEAVSPEGSAADADTTKRVEEGAEAKSAPEPEAAASPTPASPDPDPEAVSPEGSAADADTTKRVEEGVEEKSAPAPEPEAAASPTPTSPEPTPEAVTSEEPAANAKTAERIKEVTEPKPLPAEEKRPRRGAGWLTARAHLTSSRGDRRKSSTGKTLLTRFDFKRAIGIYIDDLGVYVALVAQTPFGPVLRRALHKPFAPPSPKEPNAKPHVLVVEGDGEVRELVRDLLLGRGFDVSTAVDGLDAIQKLPDPEIDLIVTELVMPRLDGIGFLKALKEISPRPPVIVMSAYETIDRSDITCAVEATKQGAYGYLAKPIWGETFFQMVDKCLEDQRLQAQVGLKREELGQRIPELISECCGKKLPKTVIAGIQPKDVFFAGLPAPTGPNNKLSAEELLSGGLQAPFLDAKSLTLDSIPVTLGKKAFVLLAASRRDRISETIQPYFKGAIEPLRCEPGAWAALRASWFYAPPGPRKSLEVRFLLGPTGGLAVLAQEKCPLMWQVIECNAERDQETLLGALRSLENHARRRTGLGPIERIVIQGHEDWPAPTDSLTEGSSVPVSWVQGPPYDGHLIALGLGLGGLNLTTPALNLAHPFQPPKSLAATFPRGEAAFVTALIICLGLLLGTRMWELESTLTTLKAQSAQIAWAKNMNVHQLRNERSTLLQRAQPLANFLTGRILWTPYLAAFPTLLPEHVSLQRLQGASLIWEKSRDRVLGRRFLVLRGDASFPQEGSVDSEIDATVQALRNSSVIRKHFSVVRLTEIARRREGKREVVSFRILLLAKR